MSCSCDIYTCVFVLGSTLQSNIQGLPRACNERESTPRFCNVAANSHYSRWLRWRFSTPPQIQRLRPANSPSSRASHIIAHPIFQDPPSPPRTRSIVQPRLPLPRLHLQHLRMLMHARQQPHPHRSPDGLCNLPLVDSAQARVPSVFDPAHGRHEFGHH